MVHELRFCLVIDDYEAAARLYRDVLGLEVLLDLDDQGGRGVILKVPRATLEIVDPEHGAMVDEIEVGRALGEPVRLAVRVDDLLEVGRALAGAGAEALADPVDTPWGDRNQRFRGADGLQLTLFQSPGEG
jgi:catechol 2,3-dioxygenase-like lactoylglutathione lyase family enzyme